MGSYTVKFTFLRSGSGYSDYDFPLVQKISDPQEGMKATVIKGTRGDGSICIPGGKKSQTLKIEGIFYDDDYDFVAISTAMTAMRAAVTTDTGTLTMQYWNGASWVVVWAYTVRRIGEIDFPSSMRVDSQNYNLEFLVLSY